MFRVEAPKIAQKAKAGQFVVVRVDEQGERIPLTISEWDREEGSITVVFNKVGKTTGKLAALNEGDYIMNFVGPLGKAAEIDNYGTVVCVVGGYSTASVVPLARALKEAGNRVISIIRAADSNALFGQEKLGSYSDKVIIATGEIGYDVDGFVIEPLKQIIEEETVNKVITIGPTCVMKLVSATTRPYQIPTVASLNPIMIDGTGMCGVCRVVVGDETKFACVDGPEFDAHLVNWELLMARRCTYSGDVTPRVRYQCRNCAQW